MPITSILRIILWFSFLSLSTACLAQIPSTPSPALPADVPFQRLQGEIARAVYDFFLFQPAAREKIQ